VQPWDFAQISIDIRQPILKNICPKPHCDLRPFKNACDQHLKHVRLMSLNCCSAIKSDWLDLFSTPAFPTR
jgi:hypothetical protein